MDPVLITLMDGRGSGTEPCPSRRSFVISLPATARRFARCLRSLLSTRSYPSGPATRGGVRNCDCSLPEASSGFLGNPVLDPSRAAELGRSGVQRAAAEIPGLKRLASRGSRSRRPERTPSPPCAGTAEIVLREHRDPFRPGRRHCAGHLCLYAARSTPTAATGPDLRTAERGLSRHSLGVLARRIRAGELETVSLAILPEIDDAFTAVVGNWQRLLKVGPDDLVDHVVGFQAAQRRQQTITTSCCPWSRTLELQLRLQPL